jgi:DNA-directed RNA polymerase specialized sigma24 family protein
MNPPSDRDADVDLETLKRLLLTPAVRTLRICNLYFRQGCAAREIAARTGTTEAAVRKVIQRARRKLAGASNGTLSSRFDVLAQHTR